MSRALLTCRATACLQYNTLDNTLSRHTQRHNALFNLLRKRRHAHDCLLSFTLLAIAISESLYSKYLSTPFPPTEPILLTPHLLAHSL